jgi:ParB-like chromosome segregation protein Spo0J
MSEYKRIRIGQIREAAVHWTREYSPEEVEQMADSIKVDGQVHPITLRPHPRNPERYYELIDGGLRLKAMKDILGAASIQATVQTLNDTDAELISIRANLRGRPVSAHERDAMSLRVRELLEKKYGGKRAKSGSPKAKDIKKKPPSVHDAHLEVPEEEQRPVTDGDVAKITGRSRTAEAKLRKRNDNLGKPALANYKAGRITQTQANELAKLPKDEQSRPMAMFIDDNVRKKHKDLEEEHDREELEKIKANAPVEARKALNLIDTKLLREIQPRLDLLLTAVKGDEKVRAALAKAKPVSILRIHSMIEDLVELTGMREGR